VLESFSTRYEKRFHDGMARKIGLGPGSHADLIEDALAMLQDQSADYTSFFRALARSLRGDREALPAVIPDAAALDAWLSRWHQAVASDGRAPTAVADAMDRVNPLYIPRNHKVEEALGAATEGDIGPFDKLVDVVSHPFDERVGLEEYSQPAPASSVPYRTFCGT
jgi:uncharacterized protein YdiU (UPF0061 family)